MTPEEIAVELVKLAFSTGPHSAVGRPKTEEVCNAYKDALDAVNKARNE